MSVKPRIVLGVCVAMLCAPAAAYASAPQVATGDARSITFSSAIVTGTVGARGKDTTYAFQYGPTRSYGQQTSVAPAGKSTKNVNVSAAVVGLPPATKYHYRLIAANPDGTTHGSDRTFTTAKIPLSLSIAGVPNPDVLGTPFRVEGSLAGTGGGGRTVVLQANPFPYLTGFFNVGNAQITGPTGAFSFPFIGLQQNTQLRVVTIGHPTLVSAVVVEGVAVNVTAHARHTSRRRRVRFFGAVAPAEPGALVAIERLAPGGRFVVVGGTVVAANSRYSVVVCLRRGGVYRVLVRINDGAHVSNRSRTLLVR